VTAAETSDPVVAVFYGAGVHPSLRAGLEAATDLVAGQPGPWRLSDPDRAAQCEDMVARLAGEGLDVLDKLDAGRQALFDLRSADVLPMHMLHFVDDMEHRLLKFMSEHGPQLRSIIASSAAVPTAPTETEDGSVPDPSVFPSIEGALQYKSPKWREVIAERGLSVPVVKAELAARCAAAGRTPPATLNDLRGHRDLVQLMLHVISDQYRAAHPIPGEQP
jgi:hypothetical protein